MELKDLVGKMAIRTQKARGFAPWETDRAIRLDFMVPVPIFDDRERYMDEPVKIVAVEESQVVIERDGKRELLERKYVDEHWTDYERLLHPEEEEKEKAEKLMKEFEVAAEPINCSLRKRDMTGTAALQVIPVTGNYPPPVCSRVSIWKRNLERRLKS